MRSKDFEYVTYDLVFIINMDKLYTSTMLSKQIKKMHLLILMAILIPFWVSDIWPSSLSNSLPGYETQETNFTGSNDVEIEFISPGLISNSLYCLFFISPQDKTVVRKENSDETLAWMTAVSFEPIHSSLSVDSLEQKVYILK